MKLIVKQKVIYKSQKLVKKKTNKKDMKNKLI